MSTIWSSASFLEPCLLQIDLPALLELGLCFFFFFLKSTETMKQPFLCGTEWQKVQPKAKAGALRLGLEGSACQPCEQRHPGALTKLTRWQLEIMARRKTHILIAAGVVNINQMETCHDLRKVCWAWGGECLCTHNMNEVLMGNLKRLGSWLSFWV